MKRRTFITLLSSAAVTWPRTGLAQQIGKKRIGGLLFGTPDADPNLGAFRQGLRDLGTVEGRNIVIEYRYAEGKSEAGYATVAPELVSIKPEFHIRLVSLATWRPSLGPQQAPYRSS